MVEVHAESVTARHDDGLVVLGFELDTGESLIFQLADRLDGQDAMSKMDSYSLSTAVGATVYGGVAQAASEGSILRLGLTEQAAAALGLPRDLRLRLRDGSDMETAIAGLRLVGISVRHS